MMLNCLFLKVANMKRPAALEKRPAHESEVPDEEEPKEAETGL